MSNYLAILATVLVLACVAVDKALLRPPAAIADAYHAEVRQAAQALPRHFGSWLGVEIPVPPAAIKLLRPNVIVSRRYTNIQTGESVSFLFVHVRDARDILGHYPPVCYPGQGWTTESVEPVEWNGGEAKVDGMQYRFAQEGLDGGLRIVVDNFLLLPDGTTCRDMDAVEAVAQDRIRKVFGTGQLQLIYSTSMSPQRQSEVTEEFIRFSGQIIRAASSGESYVTQH